MPSNDVLTILKALESANLFVSIDGGWGVDALLERQTRPHDDLDLVIDVEQVSVVRETLRLLGFVQTEDEMPTRFVLTATGDRRIDFHPMYFDDTGYAHQRLPGGRLFTCRATALRAQGCIGGCAVQCLSPELQLAVHSGYEPDEDDWQDVAGLCHRFELSPPEGYSLESG